MTGYRRGFMWATLIASTVVALGIFLQAYSITAYIAGAGKDALDLHSNVGFAVLHPLEVIAFIGLIVALWGSWREVAFAFLLPLIGTIQIALAPSDTDKPYSGWVHGLHGLLAIVVLVLAAILAHRAMRALGLRRAAAV
jgi:hypothetical protein